MLWRDNPELQQRYENILAETRRLQKDFGIEPKSLEQRYKIFSERKEQELAAELERQRQLKELEKFKAQMPKIRPPLRRP